MSRVPQALADAVDRRRLVVFCGAGLSMGSPSNLPDWWTLNQLVLDEARRMALSELPDLDPQPRAAVEALSLEDLSVVSFSETIVKTFAGDSWFPVLGVLDSDRANPSHHALADLARQGVLRAIVSTNFDTLIERAFREVAVPLGVFGRPEEYGAGLGDSCALYKIHGSAKDSGSIVDTVSQKLRGLPLATRARVAELARDHHVLVLGYSGADLAFADDYLGIADELHAGPGITWLVQPGRDPAPRAQRLIAAAGPRGAALEGVLPDFLGELGAAVAVASDEASGGRERANERAQGAIRSWLAEAHIGPLVCAVYLARLLALLGKRGEARALRARIGAHPDIAGPAVPLTAQVVYGSLGVDSIDDRDFDAARHFNQRSLAIGRGLLAVYEQHGLSVPPDVEREQARNMASSWMNLAVVAEALGEHDEARRALELALPLADAAGHTTVLAAIQLKYAEIDAADGGRLDDALTRLDAARVHTLDAGDAERLIEIELRAAETYLQLAEYDAAIAALERAQPYVELSPDVSLELGRRHLLAVVAARRGSLDDAVRQFVNVIHDADSRPFVADGIRWLFCRELCFYAPARAHLLEAIDALLERPPERLAAHGPDEDTVRMMRDLVAGGDERLAPPFLYEEATEPEARVRQAIRVLELEGRLEELAPAFARLSDFYDQERPLVRAVDLARAQLAAAERAGRHDQRVDALNALGIAHDLAGQLDDAVRSYRTALASEPAPAPPVMASLQHNLAVTLARQRAYPEALAFFRAAADGQHALGNPTEEARSLQAVASALLRMGDAEQALAVANAALAVAETSDHPAAVPNVSATVARIEGVVSGAQPAPGTIALDSSLVERAHAQESAWEAVPLDALRQEAVTPERLGTLSLREWEAGERESAWAHSREAVMLYAAREDRLGISRCRNNQAEFCAAVEDWDEACRLSGEALAIRAELGDVDGQVFTLAMLARYELGRDRPAAAAEAAARSLALARGRPPALVVFEAAIAQLEAYERLDAVAELVAAAAECLAVLDRIDAPEYDDLRPQLEALVAVGSASRNNARVAPPADRFEEGLAEATRLAFLGNVEAVDAVLGELERDFALSPQQQGWAEGTRGNALQNAGRDDEATAAYRRATELLASAGDADGASQAATQGAVSLRRLGDLAGSEQVLREALAHAPPSARQRQIETTLANTLIDRYQFSEHPAASLLEEARALLTAAAEEATGVEEHGIALVNLANVEALEGDTDARLEHLREALYDLRRANSRHVPQVEELLAGLEN